VQQLFGFLDLSSRSIISLTIYESGSNCTKATFKLWCVERIVCDSSSFSLMVYSMWFNRKGTSLYETVSILDLLAASRTAICPAEISSFAVNYDGRTMFSKYFILSTRWYFQIKKRVRTNATGIISENVRLVAKAA